MSDDDSSRHPSSESTVRRRQFVTGVGTAAVGTGLVGLGSADEAENEDEGADDDTGGNDEYTAADTTVVAHRGFAGRYPENTVEACVRSARDGADMVEIDVMACEGGEVVVFHDDGLAERDGGERGLTDTEGLVWETPRDTVLSAEVLHSGGTVPLLTEVMNAIPDDYAVNIEFKNPGSGDLRFAEHLSGETLEAQKAVWRPFTKRVLDVAERYENPVLASSFYEAALATVRETDDSVPVAPLLWDSVEDGLAIARKYDAEAVHPPYNMVQGTPFYGDEYYTEGSDWSDTDLLAVAHEEGRAVNVYTVGTWYQAERLAAAGVDGIIADYPGLLSVDGERSDA
ncbi:glycerophosphodiester phosphodiesterase [Halomarina litorea]|uniref:glycerophosphodiester phosphodiesterase n=1 Tax=Halomarina litorea TaxID=2961595 RepID=UPI0020C328A3|nr:glycerophosphodiester phosphodiesterase [Halomarina sp. BCD28]